MTTRQREPRHHDSAHLAFVRAQPCCIKHCNRPSEAAHVRMACLAIGKEYTGKGEKPSDRWTVPLCGYHHRTGIAAQHTMAEDEFWKMVGLNPFAIAALLWTQSGGEGRAAMPQVVKQPRKIKARKPREKRKKVGPSRPMQSRSNFPSRKFPDQRSAQ